MEIISIVLSVYNEELGILEFSEKLFQSILKVQGYQFELIWVNDGSSDKSGEIIKEKILSIKSLNWKSKYIEFSKNFGHEAAMLAGIDHSNGSAVICMDTDMQHPPELIHELIHFYELGYSIVLPKRKHNPDTLVINRLSTNLFYRIINFLSPKVRFEQGISDFYLLKKEVISILKTEYRFSTRWIRGVIQDIGFKTIKFEYFAEGRKFGKSKYSLNKLFKLSFDAIFSFSFRPLHLAKYTSIIFLLSSILLAIYSLKNYLIGSKPPSGYTTIIIFISLAFTILFFILATISFYLEKLIAEIFKKPLYIIKNDYEKK